MDFPVLYVLFVGVAVGTLFWAVVRQAEIFRIAIEDGRPRVVRGKPPPGFVDDVRTIARPVKAGAVWAVKEGGQPRLCATSSVDDATLQRLRNAFAVRRKR
jgi:hypothetical protein